MVYRHQKETESTKKIDQHAALQIDGRSDAPPRRILIRTGISAWLAKSAYSEPIVIKGTCKTFAIQSKENRRGARGLIAQNCVESVPSLASYRCKPLFPVP